MNMETVTSVNQGLAIIFLRLAVELVVLILIIPVIYKGFGGKKEKMFSYFLMGMTIFMICVLLKNVQIQLGIALGLFAIFSIVRFRTSNFSSKEMSYLITIMGISAINAMFDFPNPIRGTILFNAILILTILFLEIFFREDVKTGKKDEKKKKKKGEKKAKKEKQKNRVRLVYDNFKLLGPDNKIEMLNDISKRTGKDVYDVKIRKIDLMKGNAELDAYFGKEPDTE